MKRILSLIILITTLSYTSSLFAKKSSDNKDMHVVTQTTMAKIYDQVKTPYKYGLVVAPKDNHHKMDCPTVFRKDGKWYMTFVIYNGASGHDGRGYETWMAESNDLLHWKIKGRLLAYRDGMWDSDQRGGFPSLEDMNWGGSYELQPYKDKYWMTYIGGPNPGYEAGPLKIGLAYTPEKDLTVAHEWKAFSKPILSPEDKDHQWFDNIIQYKSTVYWDKKKTLGAQFVMFYNAGGINPANHVKAERIGIALSNDMKHWKRYPGNPVFTHEEGITGDAQVQRFGNLYVMFYYSAFRADRPYKAFNTFACSYDLVHWYDWKGKDLIYPTKKYDNLFAHKSFVVNYKGVVYHFYCAVDNYFQRGIAVATSRPMGRSDVHFPAPEVKQRRTIVNLDKDWKTWMKKDTLTVNIPHNWDDYYGYRQLRHGNLHGTATYSKTFIAPNPGSDKEYFLRFEGVGTYATVIVNGIKIGRFLGGRTVFTLDVTKEIKPGKENHLTVIAEHPAMITDMPWVCGGCSSEPGFSEGSQPLGIFRPVTLVVTDKVRIEPFGVHVWNNAKRDSVFIDTEIKNYSDQDADIQVVNKLNDEDGRKVFRLPVDIHIKAGETKTIHQSSPVKNPHLWNLNYPYLYSLASMIKRDKKTTDEITTPFGIRSISWPVKRKNGDNRFYLNGKPVFINGVCEYEHLFGQSHAFSADEIYSRVRQVEAAGFNAFRDAHQPHNLLYNKYWDKDGILWWPQFSAHIWYDTPEFRSHFKTLLREWVKERRNSPSLIMWGLQNESALPKKFAEECSNIIREMDPTTKNMRVITTCNGGSGTDWNVAQNWSGTYGGNLFNYANELKQPDELLNGEYGAWRSIGFHTEPAPFSPDSAWSENHMCQILETKIRLANQVKDSVCGQFMWLFNSHDNPGRQQPDEAYRVIDKIGPVNYKGLLTSWEEPTDAYYMYRANFVSADKQPMVYLVSHTWYNRFKKPGRATIEVYSNCDSVKLYNDATNDHYLGMKKNHGIGTHFMWEHRFIKYNVLKAVGYYGGKPVTEDILVLNNLVRAPHFDSLYVGDQLTWMRPISIKGDPKYNYLYRLNCGGDAYTDEFGQQWLKDDTTFSRSWAADFPRLNPYQTSEGTDYDPIRNTRDWSLFGHFRFGRHKLRFTFPVPNGKYRVELYFVEPWLGTGGVAGTDCEGMRIFDVAVNDSIVLNDLDIWAEAGHNGAMKKVVYADVRGGKLVVSFPETKAGQAMISAIAIATTDKNIHVPTLKQSDWSWAKANKEVLAKTPLDMLPKDNSVRPATAYLATKATIKGKTSPITLRKKEGIQFKTGKSNSIQWKVSTGIAQVYALRFNYMNPTGAPAKVNLQMIDNSGTVVRNDSITFPPTKMKWKMLNTTTGTFINAGNYKVVLKEDLGKIAFESLEIQ